MENKSCSQNGVFREKRCLMTVSRAPLSVGTASVPTIHLISLKWHYSDYYIVLVCWNRRALLLPNSALILAEIKAMIEYIYKFISSVTMVISLKTQWVIIIPCKNQPNKPLALVHLKCQAILTGTVDWYDEAGGCLLYRIKTNELTKTPNTDMISLLYSN